MSGEPWSDGKIEAALKRGPHFLSKEGIEFLQNEIADMINKQQWIVLPVDMIKRMFSLQLSRIGLVPKRIAAIEWFLTTVTLMSIPTRSTLCL